MHLLNNGESRVQNDPILTGHVTVLKSLPDSLVVDSHRVNNLPPIKSK